MLRFVVECDAEDCGSSAELDPEEGEREVYVAPLRGRASSSTIIVDGPLKLPPGWSSTDTGDFCPEHA